MSGWIKVEKDLANDPRVLRMASRLSHADVTLASRSRLVVVGALVTLWWYADTHISNDDVLAIGADEVDELVGLKGFCALVPPDWLQVLDADHVKLVDYTAHNGSLAKNKALGQKRQQRHREKPTSTSRSRHARVTLSALPDKTRLDRDKTDTEEKNLGPTDPVELKLDVGPVGRVFDHWKQVHNHPKAKLDPKRRRVIEAALKLFSEADLCLSITGYLNSAYHMGQNERSTIYDDIELFLRDTKRIEAGLGHGSAPPPQNLSSLTRRNVAATSDWVPPEMRRAGK